jgi:non-specific serine/threonine protein kinase
MEGRTLARRYLVGDLIGRGSAGAVYRAVDLRTGGTVAVKVPAALQGRRGQLGDLEQEARRAAALVTPHVVRIIDVDEQAGTPFLVMEYVPGATLHEILAARGRLPVDEALAIAIGVAYALSAADTAGIMHGDLSPANIKVTDGQVKVLDFGLSRAFAPRRAGRAGGMRATPEYCAPERWRSAGDIRADIYALGVILFELVEGQRPFQGPTPRAIMRRHTTVPPPISDGLPRVLADLLRRCLAKDQAARFQTPGELIEALLTAQRTIARSGDDVASDRPDVPRATPAAPERESMRVPSTPPPTLELPPYRGNLPAHLTRFIGRGRELGQARRLIATTRLLTLTGPGGCGKTRLALAAAEAVAGAEVDEVWVVQLAALTDPALVPQAVAWALGVREAGAQPLLERLIAALRPRRALLVLDNCEHLVAACAHLAEALLHACPELRCLATSREALAVAGERVWPVPPLSLPPAGSAGAEGGASLRSAHRSDAVRLFVERVREVRPSFTLTRDNAAVATQICRRLDGLPLAIELAAARASALTVEEIGARLDDRFALLTSAPRTALPRHRTLRAALDWSHDLLTDPERALFRRLAVFAGGFTLEAAAYLTPPASLPSQGRGEPGQPRLHEPPPFPARRVMWIIPRRGPGVARG